jgi:hypothetical protein
MKKPLVVIVALASVIGIGVVILGATQGWFTSRPSPPDAELLYSFQDRFQDDLSGNPKTRQVKAALLPLRILLALNEQNPKKERLGDYLTTIQDYVIRNKVKKAIPLFERALRANALPGMGADISKFAAAWYKLKTASMNDEQKGRVLATALSPEAGMVGHEVYREEFHKLSKEAKKPLLAMLTASTGAMHKGDWLKAVAIEYLLCDKKFAPTEAEIRSLLKVKSSFTQATLIGVLARRKDKRALQVARSVWRRSSSDGQREVRLITTRAMLTSVPGHGQLYLEFLRQLDKEPASKFGSSLRWRLLADLCNADTPDLTEGLLVYLKAYVSKPSRLPSKPKHGPERYVALYHEHLAISWAKMILAKAEKKQ